jgi:hypothetical protein
MAARKRLSNEDEEISGNGRNLLTRGRDLRNK